MNDVEVHFLFIFHVKKKIVSVEEEIVSDYRFPIGIFWKSSPDVD